MMWNDLAADMNDGAQGFDAGRGARHDAIFDDFRQVRQDAATGGDLCWIS
jgi:hypothetical protein